ncbi:hypothetical protein EBR56_11370 [bacterium]|nr:hypothetical protein [bacterium]
MAACGAAALAQGVPAGSIYRRGAEDVGQGERLVAAAIDGLGRAASISARVRQLARVGDTVLKGGGRYVQSGTGREQRFRLESRISSDTETFDILEICDGLFFWNYRHLGMQQATIERVDVQRVHEHLDNLKFPPRPSDGPFLGGIQRMLTRVRESFRFTVATAQELDGMPVWTVEGEWSKSSLAFLLPDQAAAINGPAGISAADIPEGMPWSVRLSIGRRELFPFRIEWLAIPGPRPAAATTPEVVAVFELYDVRIGEPVDATAFIYKPALGGLMDVTDQHLKELSPPRQ